MLNRLIGLIVIAGLVMLAVATYKHNTVDFNGYYYRDDNGITKLLHINEDDGILYNINNGKVVKIATTIKKLEANEILSFTALEAVIFKKEAEKLKEVDNDYEYIKISSKKFNEYLEEAKK